MTLLQPDSSLPRAALRYPERPGPASGPPLEPAAVSRQPSGEAVLPDAGRPPYPPIEDLVPHGLPMRVLEEMLDWRPGHAVCRMRLRAHAPFVQGRAVQSVVALEYLAQAVAACLGYEAYLGGGRIRVGMIIGVRKMEIFRPQILVGSEVRTIVERIRGDEEVSTFRGEAYSDGEKICVAHMTLVHPEKPPASEA